MGTLHHDEIGLVWADVAVSARNLVRGTLNPHLENALMLAPEEQRARLIEVRRRRAARKRKFDFEDAEDEREEQSILADFQQMQSAVDQYAGGGDLSWRFTPDCDSAIKAELAHSQKEVLKAAAPEIKAVEEAAPPGWTVSGKRASGPFVSITQRIRIADLAAKPVFLSRGDLRENIRRGLEQVCAPGFDRKAVAAAVSAFIAATLADDPPVSELRPSRWYPSNLVAGGSAEEAAPMVERALSPHTPLPAQQPASLDDLTRSVAGLPEASKAASGYARKWRKWNAALRAAERKHDWISIQRLMNSGPDPPT